MSAHTHSHAPVPAASTAGSSYHYGGRLTPDGTVVDPIVVEIIEGALASVELDVETAIGRTSRSPMRTEPSLTSIRRTSSEMSRAMPIAGHRLRAVGPHCSVRHDTSPMRVAAASTSAR